MKDTNGLTDQWDSHRDTVEKILVNVGDYKCQCGKRAGYLQARNPVNFELVCIGCQIFGIKFKLPIVDRKTMEELRIIQLQFDRHIYT